MHDRPIGSFLTLREFCTCTDTYRLFSETIDPWPKASESITALEGLANNLLDPIIAHYGRHRFQLTYGFCSESLSKQLTKKKPGSNEPYGRVALSLDQHMAFERNTKGQLRCKRAGAACDFRLQGVSTREVLRWLISERLPFDRAYFYGDDRSLHLSWGPDHSRYLCGFNAHNVPTVGPVRELVELAKEVYRI